MKEYETLGEFLREGINTDAAPESATPADQEDAGAPADHDEDAELQELVESGERFLADCGFADSAADVDARGFRARDVLCASVGLYGQHGDGDQIIDVRVRQIRRELIGINAHRAITAADIVERLRMAFAMRTRDVELHVIARERIQASFAGLLPADAWDGPGMKWWAD